MKLSAFLKDRCLIFILHIVCMGLLSGFLYMTGYGKSEILLILIFWMLILCGWTGVTYLQRRKYFKEAAQIMEKLDQRYLLGELLPDSYRLEDQLYRDLIRYSNKSMIERVRQIEDEQKEYQEYMESWVHEVKAPITSIALMCDNRRKSVDDNMEGISDKETFRAISMENQKIENYVDRVLYLARAKQVYKDYMIRETSLYQVVCEVLEKNRLLLIQNRVRAEVDCEDRVYTDQKWIAFILNQMILNSVKYQSEDPVFHFVSKRTEKSVLLLMEDNGVGIRTEEVGRIFEKGFTGSNGRSHERSTGMGLYLCRELCDKLGIGIRAESVEGEGTRMILEFPVSTYISRESF
ncbi:MAG: sensor histidine kinase [Dorea sp.]